MSVATHAELVKKARAAGMNVRDAKAYADSAIKTLSRLAKYKQTKAETEPASTVTAPSWTKAEQSLHYQNQFKRSQP
jgi:hypothetical protein